MTKRITIYWLTLLASIIFPLCLTGQTVVLEETFDEVSGGTNTGNPRFPGLPRWSGNDNVLEAKTVYQADKAIYVGSLSNSAIGYLVLRSLDLSANAGIFEVSVRIKGGFTNGSGKLKVSIEDNETSAQEYLPTKYRGDEWETHTFSFVGGTNATVIRLETVNNPEAKNCKSVYIDNIVISQRAGEPTLASETKLIDLKRVNIGQSLLHQEEVMGSNLTEPVTSEIQGVDKDAFEIKTSSTQGDKTTIQFEFTPTVAKKYEATLHVASGSVSIDIPITAVGVDPQNPYGIDADAQPVDALDEPFTEDPLLTTWREIAFEGDVHWERKMPYNAEPVMIIDAAGSRQQVRSALITPLINIPGDTYVATLSLDYQVGNAKGGQLIIKRLGKDGQLIADLETIVPSEPTSGIAYKPVHLALSIPSDDKDSYIVFEYIADDSAEDEAERKTTTFLIDNVQFVATEIPAPVIRCSLEEINFGEITSGTSSVKSIDITGENILSRITAEVTGRDKDLFEIDKLSLPAMGGTIQITLKGTKETSLEAKLILTAKGAKDSMTATKEIPLTGKIITSVQEILNTPDAVCFTSEGIMVRCDAHVALYTADGVKLLEGGYHQGDIIKINYTGSLIAYVEGVVYRGVLY